MIAAALRAVERFLLPNACVVCHSSVNPATPDALVCGPCRSRLRPVPLGCDRCRQPLPPVGPCRFCEEWPEGFTHATSAVWLGSEAREIVHHLKYEGFSKLAELMATTIVHQTPKPPQNARLVPIPLGFKRRLNRGYNQAAELAKSLGEIWSTPVDESVIKRRMETKSQTSLTPEERIRNVKGVFRAIRPLAHVDAKIDTATLVGAAGERRITVAPKPNVAILVDDVLTTGATLASAATALLDAGWVEVRAVTYARALPFAVRVEAQC